MARTKIRVSGSKDQVRMVRRVLPWVGAAALGGMSAVAAAAIGAGELVVGALAAYAGYRYLREETSVSRAGRSSRQGGRSHKAESQKSRRAA